MSNISIEKDFDVKTLLIIMSGDKDAINELAERNIDRFRKANTVRYAEDLEMLNQKTTEYKTILTSKLAATRQRLESTDNGISLNTKETGKCFLRSIEAVREAIAKLNVDMPAAELNIDMPAEIKEELYDVFEPQKSEADSHLDMFIDNYKEKLETIEYNYLKDYIYTLIRYGYLFDANHNGEKYSLLVFLAFYEAYAKRIIGLSLLDLNQAKLRVLIEEKKYYCDEAIELISLNAILKYSNDVHRSSVKSCYFVELQKRFKGDIGEFVKRFLINKVDEKHEIMYQKNTLIDKKMLRSGKCTEMIDPPVTIPTPPLIREFFQISDSHYMLI